MLRGLDSGTSDSTGAPDCVLSRVGEVTTYDVPVAATDDPLSALPPPRARAAAFVAILVGGLAGGLIGYTLVKLQCHGACATQRGLGSLFGAIVAAIGMSIVAVLVLRAVGEWKEVERREKNDTAR
ncbi:MAG: hypothetical protein QOE00_2774 [Ilumatobacteraceae bacterium]